MQFVFGCPSIARHTMVGILVVQVVMIFSGRALAQSGDRAISESHGWIHGDLDRGLAEGARSGKPLMIVLRCPP